MSTQFFIRKLLAVGFLCFVLPATAWAACPAGQVETGKTATGASICQVPVGTPGGTGASVGGSIYKTLSGKETIQPNLEITVPGVSFTPILAKDDTITVNWIAEYVVGAYRYLLGISVTVAIIFIMIGGLQYVMAAGTGNTKAGKDKIKNAVIGLVLLFSTYLIVYGVGGARLVSFQGLELARAAPIQWPQEAEDAIVNGPAPGPTTDVTDATISGKGARRIPDDLVPALRGVASAVNTQGYTLSIASSFRTVVDQLRLIRENCQNPPGSTSCNPKPGKPDTCILRNLDPKNCAHTTGHALDVWGATLKGGQCIKQADCEKNKTACRANPCQKAVIDAMIANGFCNLAGEPWHFEKPKMSSDCH